MARGETYEEFVEKFKPKKTTDDCYTPANVYDAVADWVADEYDLDRSCFVRPFWPGGDFESFEYPDGCVVVDNPPFSILKKIILFYEERGIRFFLFAHGLTTVSALCGTNETCVIGTGAMITYENGAKISTSFLTNLEREVVARSAPDLYKAIDAENRKNEKAITKDRPVYSYPPEVLTGSMLNYMSVHGTRFKVRRGAVRFIRRLDSQREMKKNIFGGGLLLAEKAAAEKAAAEKAAAEKAAATRWSISDREREIIKELSAGA